MLLRLKTRADVRVFSIAMTALVLLGTLVLQQLFLPVAALDQLRLPGLAITVCLVAPMSFFIGTRLRDAFCLSVDLERSVRYDPLTGLLTRRALFERAPALDNVPGVVIVSDIDHFKRFNDYFGHATGDAALRWVARCFLTHCRAEDLLARFGGEEFVIILPDTSEGDGVAVAERLCRCLRDSPLLHRGDHLSITASFGVAAMECPDQIDDAILRADAALYKAKDAGRDQVCRDAQEASAPG